MYKLVENIINFQISMIMINHLTERVLNCYKSGSGSYLLKNQWLMGWLSSRVETTNRKPVVTG